MSLSGIYAIASKIDDRMYIGSSTNVAKRLSTHFLQLRKGIHSNAKMQNFVNRHGVDSLKSFQICSFPPDMLLEREQLLIDFHMPEFNIATSTSSPMSGRNHTPEARKRMSFTRRGRKMPPRTKEHTNNIVEKRLSMNLKHTEDAKNRISSSMQRGKCYCAKLVLDTLTGVFYDCAIDAAISANMSPYTLRNKLNGQKKNNTKFLYV